MSEVNDKELQACMDGLRRGDMASFEALYDELKTPVYTVLLRITADRWLAEDLLQEYFVRLYQSPPQEVKKLRAYLLQIARNLAIDALRKREPELFTEQEMAAYPLEHHVLRLDLESAMQHLSLPERQVVALHLNGGLKFREIARMLEQPVGTVYSCYRRAIGKLRILLDGGSL